MVTSYSELLDQILHEFEEVSVKRGVHSIESRTSWEEIKPDARPRFYKPRSVPYAIKSAIEQDLKWLEKWKFQKKYIDWSHLR